MITKLGKELRKLRLDLGITLNEMAVRIGVSPSLLSSAETGKKTATPSLIDKLSEQFDYVQQRKDAFLAMAEETKSEVRIRLLEDNDRANGVALALARNFEKLTPEQLDEMDRILAAFHKPKKGA